MGNVIASTYEILEKLGAGGGGVIYLANHLRLNKKVVVKIDKRSIATDPELLRREVDVLKNLSHTYIPQVYDYFVEDGAVCTVMDFVPGESLDKPLKRGEKFSQPQVIEWACQILEALDYLHHVDHGTKNVGYVHGDIKPANIMRKPDNSVCLIDFNIALALGETSVIGCSPGYASPEHYGESFSSDDITFGSQSLNSRSFGEKLGLRQPEEKQQKEISKNESFRLTDDGKSTELLNQENSITGNTITELLYSSDRTEPLSDSQTTINLVDDSSWLPLRNDAGSATELIAENSKSQLLQDLQNDNKERGAGQSITSVPKMITPGIQSDIYSLGATLYHLLSGVKPPRDARQVVPLSTEIVSMQISDIIAKAMNPDITQRYQSAYEMLEAFRDLHKNDKRMLHFKKTRKIVFGGLSATLAIGIFVSFVGLARMRTTERWLKLAELSQNSYRDGNVNEALNYALDAFPNRRFIFTPTYTSSSQRALTNALGVYDLSDGFKHHGLVELSSAPFDLVISPSGETAACITEKTASIIDLENSKIIKTLPADASALSEIKYINKDVVVYSGDKGITAYCISKDKLIWTGKKSTSISVSADGKAVAAVYKDETFASVYNAETGKLLQTIDFNGKKQSVVANDTFANPNDNLFTLNKDGSMLAVSFNDGSLMLYNLISSNDDDDLEIFDSTSGYSLFEGGFYSEYFAFSATGKNRTTFSIINTKKKIATGGAKLELYVGVSTDENGIYLSQGNAFARIDPQTGTQTPLINAQENIEHYSKSSKYTAVSSGRNVMFFNDKAGKINEIQDKNQVDFICVSDLYSVFAGHDSQHISIMKYEENKQKSEIIYDSSIKHDEARISSDGKILMLFNYKEFTLTDLKGNVITTVEIHDPEQVYDQQYRRKDGKSYLEVTYNDGTIDRYDAISGNKLEGSKTDKIASNLGEVFYTDKFKVDSPLHGEPKVYDKKSGKLIAKLQSDSYLTYVTQIGENIIVQYRNADGYYYGQILNNKCEIIADLPYLCDVYNGEVFFDYPEGVVRKTTVFNLGDLLSLAKK